jgi:hypothetical protein
MQRSLIAVFALSCVLSCSGFSQQQSSQPQSSTPSSATPAPAGQAPAAATPPAANPGAVASDQPVITLKGACDAKAGSAPAAGCISTVTKEQFEKLVNALKPDLTTEQKRNFAQHYATLLVFTDVSRSLGLENDPKVKELFQFAQSQILAQAVNEHYSDQFAHPTDQQIDDSYKQNSKKYIEATLQRVIIPRVTSSGDKPKPSDAEEKEYVEQVREKWVGGSDPAKLQAEAMEHAGLKSAAPDVNIGAKHPGTLPAQHEAVFDLKSGEVSQPYNDPSAFYLYKLVSVRQVPLAEVKDSIAKTLSQQLLKDKMESISNSVTPTLNETYFGPPTPPAGPPGTPQPHPAQPGAPPQAAPQNQSHAQ